MAPRRARAAGHHGERMGMLVGVIVGEFFASGGGLGFLIIKYGYELDMERVYAAVVWIVFVSLALNGVFGRVERVFDAWRTP